MSAAVLIGDCLEVLRGLPDSMAQACVTSPPYYGLRDYGHAGQIGLEETPDAYVARLVDVFREVLRVLRDDGTCWLNLGDSYARAGGEGGCGPNAQVGNTQSGEQRRGLVPPSGYKPKDLLGIPWMVAFALRADGWWLRQDIIWHKPNPMPESVKDRCTKSHEYIFLLSKSQKYLFDSQAMEEVANDGGKKNRRSVWTIPTRPYKGAHFAVFPTALIEPCILAGSRPGDIVLDPFMGSGTTAAVALQHGRQYLGCELNPEYGQLQQERINKAMPAISDDPQLSLVLEQSDAP